MWSRFVCLLVSPYRYAFLIALSRFAFLPVPRVAGRGVLLSHFVLRPAHPLDAIEGCSLLACSRSAVGGRPRLVPAFRCYRAASVSSRLLAPPFVSVGGEMSGGDVCSGDLFFLWDFCAVG